MCANVQTCLQGGTQICQVGDRNVSLCLKLCLFSSFINSEDINQRMLLYTDPPQNKFLVVLMLWRTGVSLGTNLMLAMIDPEHSALHLFADWSEFPCWPLSTTTTLKPQGRSKAVSDWCILAGRAESFVQLVSFTFFFPFTNRLFLRHTYFSLFISPSIHLYFVLCIASIHYLTFSFLPKSIYAWQTGTKEEGVKEGRKAGRDVWFFLLHYHLHCCRWTFTLSKCNLQQSHHGALIQT